MEELKVMEWSLQARKERPKEEKCERLSLPDVSNNILGEARMVLPGIQTLAGFQLVAVFNNRFETLEPSLQVLHFAALCLTIIATTLIMSPAAYDRLTDPYEVSDKFIKWTSTMIALAMVPLLISLSLDVFVIGSMVFKHGYTAAAIATLIASLMAFLWFFAPKIVAKQSHL